MENTAQLQVDEEWTSDGIGEVLAGLRGEQKHLSSKWLYDARGSALFEAICALPEYYPTRTEQALLGRHAAEIASLIGPGSIVIEPGSGSSEKIRLILGALEPALYAPSDICREQLDGAVGALRRDFPWLRIEGHRTDFTGLPRIAAGLPPGRRLLFFPGSTIGNFEPAAAAAFLRRIVHLLGPNGAALIGVDLRKEPERLHAAYNDRQGVTAAFNLNLLARLNREIGTEFDLAGFHHYAFYNIPRSRVEMHLVSNRVQSVRIGGERIAFEEGESLHTENSYKYTVTGFQSLAVRAGLRPERVWVDEEGLFSLHYLGVGRASPAGC